MDMNDPTNKAIDNALDRYLSPIVYVAIGLGLITFILINYWGTILILLMLAGVGFVALTQRDAMAGFFKSLFNSPPPPPPETPKPPDDFPNMLGKALQIALEQEHLPLPSNEVFTLAIRVGVKLINSEDYSLPDELDPSYDADKEEEADRDRVTVMRALGHEVTPSFKRKGPLEIQGMREVYPRIAIKASDAIFDSLLVYMKNFPRVEDGPFLTSVVTKINFPHVIYEMLKPFREEQVLKSFNLLQFVPYVFDRNVRALPPVGKELMWPQHYNGPPEQIAEVYLKDHAFLPLFQLQIPFNPFTEENRHAHHWCLGKTGRGKTTFLRHLIKHDLESAEWDKCSVVVIDSKKLIREMRTLSQFAGNLEGHVTLIDSDEPFPLNPFTLPRQQARPIIMYMLAEMTFASGLQTGALTYLVDAALQSKKPSLRVMRDFFALDLRKGQLPEDFDSFDADTKHWFEHTFKELPPATRSASTRGSPTSSRSMSSDWPACLRRIASDSISMSFIKADKCGSLTPTWPKTGLTGQTCSGASSSPCWSN